MSELNTKPSQYQLNQELVELVAYTVEAIAKSKGYPVYPREAEVVLVLQALYLVNAAIKAAMEVKDEKV